MSTQTNKQTTVVGDQNAAERVLALEFVTQLKACLSADQLAEIRKRNATPQYSGDVCASHDFIDANMVMNDAFEKVVGRELDAQNGADCVLWSKAWDIAKREFLTEFLSNVGSVRRKIVIDYDPEPDFSWLTQPELKNENKKNHIALAMTVYEMGDNDWKIVDSLGNIDFLKGGNDWAIGTFYYVSELPVGYLRELATEAGLPLQRKIEPTLIARAVGGMIDCVTVKQVEGRA